MVGFGFDKATLTRGANQPPLKTLTILGTLPLCSISSIPTQGFRNGDLVPVRIPPASDEAVRDVCRARTGTVEDLTPTKQRLKSFLMHNGFRPKAPSWGPAYMRYLRDLVLPDSNQKIVLEEYLHAIETGIERVARLERKMFELLANWEWEPVVRSLMAMKGFKEVAAMIAISELGGLTRFKHPRQRRPARP